MSSALLYFFFNVGATDIDAQIFEATNFVIYLWNLIFHSQSSMKSSTLSQSNLLNNNLLDETLFKEGIYMLVY